MQNYAQLNPRCNGRSPGIFFGEPENTS
jgi:hypothetical protein